MTPTREEVERLVSEVTAAFPNNDYGGSDEALRMGAVPVDASACMETAAMLRALLARAEAAEAELAVEQEARELASESDAGWEQVASAARAEAARLRRGWLATIQTENSCPATGGGCLAKRCGCLAEMEMLMREDDARAALVTEARDE